MGSFALAAIGRDRPGIVAGIAAVLYERGCNVEDSSMTLLRGNFAIQLVLRSPELGAEELTEALRPACDDLGLTFNVLPVEDTAEVPHPSHILTVYGADRPGILYRVTKALAERRVNITDLNSRLVGADKPVYALMLELAPPEGLSADALRTELRSLADEVGVEVSLRELEDDVL